jgi:hypothetical protein
MFLALPVLENEGTFSNRGYVGFPGVVIRLAAEYLALILEEVLMMQINKFVGLASSLACRWW